LSTTLLRRVRPAGRPPAFPATGPGPAACGPALVQAILVEAGRIAWIGPDAEAAVLIDTLPGGDVTVLDLHGALVLPAFVDAHAHVTETGLLLDGVDLSGARSVVEILDAVAAAAARPAGQVLGHGWDELNLAEGRPPTGAELDRAGAGRPVYLSRVDVHSAVISSSLARLCGAPGLAGWAPDGRVERDAHHAARHSTRFGLSPAQRRRLQVLALRSAAAVGIGELHEMSAPHVAPDEDLIWLLALAGGVPDDPGTGLLPAVVPYRGELAADEVQARAIVAGLRAAGLPWLAGLAGDLNIDGSFGSRTAALRQDYADAPGHRGHLYLDADQVRDHVVACTGAGLQAGFHVIGDAAVDTLLAGLQTAAEKVGLPAFRAARHRFEHLESLDAAQVAALARLGVVASVQPAFDAAWGGTDRMYAIRLGAGRAAGLNPFATMTAAGMPLAFGSDSPVTSFAPWEAVRAALLHRTTAERIDLATAIRAHTAGGRFAAGSRPPSPVSGRRRAGGPAPVPQSMVDDGTLRVGGPATLACWRSPGLSAAGADPLAALAEELTGSDPAPACVLTMIAGTVVFSAG